MILAHLIEQAVLQGVTRLAVHKITDAVLMLLRNAALKLHSCMGTLRLALLHKVWPHRVELSTASLEGESIHGTKPPCSLCRRFVILLLLHC